MIQVFVTGGTFDKEYNYLSGGLYFKETHLPKILTRGRSTLDVDIRTLMMVDSLEMNDEDRQIIAHNVQRSSSSKIVITHGTDRMVETAKFLAELDIKDKTIVISVQWYLMPLEPHLMVSLILDQPLPLFKY
jgi:L-asparaginase